jgi:hypothetical protein
LKSGRRLKSVYFYKFSLFPFPALPHLLQKCGQGDEIGRSEGGRLRKASSHLLIFSSSHLLIFSRRAAAPEGVCMAGVRGDDCLNLVNVIEAAVDCREPVDHVYALPIPDGVGRTVEASVNPSTVVASDYSSCPKPAAMENDRGSAWLIARTIAASVLLLAAGAKWWAMFPWGQGWSGSIGQVLVAGQVLSEFFMAAWLLSGFYAWLAHRVAVGLFVVFTVYTGWLVFIGALSCGCFGEARVSPWIALALDFGILTGLVGFPTPTTAGRVRGWPLVRAWLVGGGIASVIAWMLVLTSTWPQISAHDILPSRQEVLEPGAWVGNTFPLLPHLSIDADLSNGNWIVVLHRPSCSSCRAIHKEYEDLGIELVLLCEILLGSRPRWRPGV